MKLETFFEKFELFAEAPDAVARMREVVLSLALQGRFLADKENSFSSTEWKWVRLGSIATIVMGNSPPGDSYNERGEGVPLINGPVEFSPGPFGLTVRTKFTSAPTKFCKRGDLLICVRGSTTGRTNIASFDACIGRGVAAINAGEYQSFVNLFLWQRRSMIFALGTGSTFPSISYKDIASLQIDLPPLAEQKRIVAKVDELMALCDQLEAQQQERQTRHAALAQASLARFTQDPTPANLQFLFHRSYPVSPADLRKTILTLAVQGKLVPRGAKDEPVDVLLDSSGKIEGKHKRKPKWSGPIKEAEKPFKLPPTWVWFRLGDVSTLKHGYAFSSEFFTSEPAPFVLTTPGNFYEKGGFRDRESKRKYYNGPVSPEFIFNPGDLIIPMTEQAAGLLGSPAFIPDDGRTYIHNQRLGRITFNQRVILPEFAFWFFNCLFFRDELARTCTGMKVRHTSPERVLRVPIPVPPLAEQRRIVAKVDELLALVDELENQLVASRTVAQNLLAALVRELTTTP